MDFFYKFEFFLCLLNQSKLKVFNKMTTYYKKTMLNDRAWRKIKTGKLIDAVNSFLSANVIYHYLLVC